MSEISETLTHSDNEITETYIYISNVVELATYEKFESRLNKERVKMNTYGDNAIWDE
ncbi:hypothetical protein UAY_00043 [Enterococcus moraviensis ATCC BAA-383]|uniref:Uncharacterized protein n=1 Tax=Enterococcus moraviensis ATCC BAA-383 TaxID=1158609 RepID=R2RGA8_9ENTE|nr:hypothetical protein [Enterococcus moraviensis]EOI06701.1 hypothetical protein UAY_00043 [Enterococcus moraviensis ATCC BAA-383]EOT65038.1 hypothetical protein I586_02772 [Enterococcus moraviensis ATCC BAA-383]OJG66884.1 hypothetical protein RV09_GL003101 [Enterococcus moraviensis]